MNDREGGFTLIESMAAMGIISIVLSILSAAASFSFHRISGPVDFLLFSVKLLRADSLARSAIETVTVPYWELKFAAEAQDRSLIIPWYGGRKEDHLSFLVSQAGELIMETENHGKKSRQVLINNLESAEITLWKDEDHVPRGVDIDYRYKGRVYRTYSAFGSSPLWRNMP
jgi:prepilin-type N-terminal cleavage/methylation domain-containing protein